MTRRRFYAPPEAFSPEAKSARLGLEETRHLRDVLRLKSGDEIFLFDGAGREFQGKLLTVGREFAEVEVTAEVDPANPESPLAFTLAVGLLKGEKFDLVIQKATELGVANLIPVVTSRADVRLKSDDDAERKVTRWRRIALEATKQCGRARLMNVEKPMNFSDLIKTPSAPNALHLMFAELGGDSLVSALGQAKQVTSVSALVGSEGGWDDDEIDQARGAGWKIVTLGGRTLRAETATIVIAALIQNRFGDLK
jgi:16S rRNA (uracil1498-N3)-methyltransferase